MKLTPVKSTNIRAIGHDPVLHVLTVQFSNGATYEYYQVPQSVASAFLRADSHGKYFAEKIKPFYEYRRVEGGK